MPIPDFQSLMRPVLGALSDGGDHSTRSLIERMSDQFNLTADERDALLPSGRQRVIANRVHWAVAYLSKCKLIDRSQRGVYRIADRGHAAIAAGVERIDLRYLGQFEELERFRRGETATEHHIEDAVDPAEAATPDERIEVALREIDLSLKEALLARILSASPTFFEKLVVQLLTRMGYGPPEGGRHIGGPGDGGVDGVINLDQLGLDKVYIQAKRYEPANKIGRPAIQGFLGALESYGTTRGVFVTTSGFTADATACAAEVRTKQIVLIDGAQLLDLLIKHGVAVQSERTMTISRLDDDFFEDAV